MVAASATNGVPQGYTELVIDSTDQLWLAVVPEPKPEPAKPEAPKTRGPEVDDWLRVHAIPGLFRPAAASSIGLMRPMRPMPTPSMKSSVFSVLERSGRLGLCHSRASSRAALYADAAGIR